MNKKSSWKGEISSGQILSARMDSLTSSTESVCYDELDMADGSLDNFTTWNIKWTSQLEVDHHEPCASVFRCAQANLSKLACCSPDSLADG